MNNKIIALVAVIVLIIAGGAYYLETMPSPATNTTAVANITPNNTTNVTHTETRHQNDTPTNNITNVKITASQAQQIAVGSAEELGREKVRAGTPILFKWTANTKHTYAWDVPLFYVSNGTSAGSMDVDAITGEVIMNE